uniref:Rhomboid domain-containing protein n=1 Tax=Panagrellus redivivus TaxID=6233 RepID=A0A7E4VRL3_PANRE
MLRFKYGDKIKFFLELVAELAHSFEMEYYYWIDGVKSPVAPFTAYMLANVLNLEFTNWQEYCFDANFLAKDDYTLYLAAEITHRAMIHFEQPPNGAHDYATQIYSALVADGSSISRLRVATAYALHNGIHTCNTLQVLDCFDPVYKCCRFAMELTDPFTPMTWLQVAQCCIAGGILALIKLSQETEFFGHYIRPLHLCPCCPYRYRNYILYWLYDDIEYAAFLNAGIIFVFASITSGFFNVPAWQIIGTFLWSCITGAQMFRLLVPEYKISGASAGMYGLFATCIINTTLTAFHGDVYWLPVVLSIVVVGLVCVEFWADLERTASEAHFGGFLCGTVLALALAPLSPFHDYSVLILILWAAATRLFFPAHRRLRRNYRFRTRVHMIHASELPW